MAIREGVDTLHMPAQIPSTPARVFSEEEIVASRYRIVRLLGRGGMGEVYEAVDQELNERVALKVVLRGAATGAAVDRFRREIQLARRVTHPNVSRIFELGYADRPEGRVMFVTMELLEGESLLTHIRTSEPMSPAEAYPLIRQMAAALDAAHAAGIVHRDFKSPNVMLTANGRRAVVMDFGLARAHDSGDAFERLTATDVIVGTPAYMAPEQLGGGDVGPAADVYALGTVIYEMMTGVLPFTGGSVFSNAVRRLNEAPPSPRAHRPDLPAHWEATLLQCLERDPQRRPASAGAVANQLAAESVRAALAVGPEPSTSSVSLRRWLRVAVPATLAAAAILTTAYLGTRDTADVTPAPKVRSAVIAIRPSIAVLTFAVERSDDGWIGVAAADAFRAAAASDGAQRVISRQEMARIARDLSIQPAARLFPATADQLLSVVGASAIVTGRVSPNEEGFRVAVAVQRKGVAPLELERSGADLHRTVQALVADVRDRLALPHLTQEALAVASAHAPASSARSYYEGLATWEKSGRAAARQLLLESARRNPTFPFGRLALAEVSGELGYERQAGEEARAAFDGSAYLPAEDRAFIEARYRAITRRWEEAGAAYRRLIELRPDVLDYRLGLASAQIEQRDAKGALGTLGEARKLGRGEGSDARIDLMEARVAEPLGDYSVKERAATRAAARVMRTGERRLLAQARFYLGQVAHGRGDFDAATAAYGEARQIYEALLDADETARMISTLAVLNEDRGELEAAASMYQQAGQIWERSGNRRGVGDTLNNRAILALRRSDASTATALWEAAVREYTDVQDLSGIAMALNNLGAVAQRQARFEDARSLLERSLASSREIGDQWAEAQTMAMLGSTLRSEGRHAASAKILGDAVTLFRKLAHDELPMALSDLAETFLRQGRVSEAASLAGDAARLATQSSDVAAQINAAVVGAHVQFEKNDVEGALRALSDALGLAEQSSDADARLRILIDRAKLRTIRGELEMAERDASAAGSLAASAKDAIASESLRVVRAVIAAERGSAREAHELAVAARQFFARVGMKDRAIEAALVEARVAALAEPAAADRALQWARNAAADVEAPAAKLLIAWTTAEVARLRGRSIETAEMNRLRADVGKTPVPRLVAALTQTGDARARSASFLALGF